MNQHHRLTKQVKTLLLLFITGLVLSGLTAFPLEWELRIACGLLLPYNNAFANWILKAYEAVHNINSNYPFIAYGTDWLAFAHLVLAIGFIGPLRNPVKNIWVIEFGLIACAGVFPLAFIAGAIRGVPFFWQCIDCSFGFFGGIILWLCLKKIKRLEIS